MEDVTLHDLYQEYPNLDIDVKREQELVAEHDVIVFQFPLFWYSTPAILKEWQDLVLEHGWAYGREGNALKDKLFLCLVTTGGPQIAYRVEGFHKHTLNQLLSPLRQTGVLCKMKPLPPFVVHGTHVLEMDEALDYKNNLLKLLRSFINNELKAEDVGEMEYLNDLLIKQD
jgi:glutathione-regulated potassium-efflux system ancillary protein KefG